MFSHNISAIKNTSHKVNGIDTAVLKAHFVHKYIASTINTIIID
jgi:hypothetical protein